MYTVTNEKLLKKVPNNYILVRMATERLKELRQGAKPLVDTNTDNLYEVFSEEVLQDKLKYKYEAEG